MGLMGDCGIGCGVPGVLVVGLGLGVLSLHLKQGWLWIQVGGGDICWVGLLFSVSYVLHDISGIPWQWTSCRQELIAR